MTRFKAAVRTDTIDGGWEEGERRERSEKEGAARTNQRLRRERQLKSAKREVISLVKKNVNVERKKREREEKWRTWRKQRGSILQRQARHKADSFEPAKWSERLTSRQGGLARHCRRRIDPHCFLHFRARKIFSVTLAKVEVNEKF